VGVSSAGVIWAWTALGLVAVVLIGIGVVSAATVSPDEVRQQAANLAFAEREYQAVHGRYTENLSDLTFGRNTRITVHVVATETEFCVDAQYNELAARTAEDQFDSAGETVRLHTGLCNGRLFQPLGPEQGQLVVDRAALMVDLEIAKLRTMPRHFAFSSRCYDKFEVKKHDIEVQLQALEARPQAGFTATDLDLGQQRVDEYSQLVARQRSC
jgi:hypothetical protein